MKSILLLSSVFGVAITGCASESLRVTVVDDMGCPVSNATVGVGFSTSHVLFGGGHSSSDKGGRAMSKTDTNGVAIVKFNCSSSDFGWRVVADGYYRGDLHNEHFAFDEIIVPPCFGKVVLHEHHKSGNETLFKIKNPQPMYAHYPIEKRKLPKENGRYGFDLAEYDWLPPHGSGKEADFYVVRDYNKLTEAGTFTVGAVEFERGCGYYIAKNTGCTSFPTEYHADTNAVFKSSMTVLCEHRKGVQEYDYPLPLVDKNSHIVLRTRVKYDDKGNMISANYSRILGEFSVLPSVSVTESIFNPIPNDANLEFDPEKNLYQGKTGRRR